MITVKLQGGLGNQMFQYALGLSLARKNRDRLVVDTTFLLDRAPRKNFVYRNYDLDIFDIAPDFTFLSKMARLLPVPLLYLFLSRAISETKNLFGRQAYVREGKPEFYPEILELTGNVYLDGYWQSEKYFKDIEDVIRREFSFGETEDAKIKAMAEKIASTESVCLNVRRGDFVNLPASIQAHGFVGTEYYRKGIELIVSKVANPHFFITSDEIEWCIHNLTIDYPHTFLTHEYEGKKFKDYLRLMSLCKHFLIPNSTFAWWAAWLGANSGKIVVVSAQWAKDPDFSPKDIYGPDWIRI